MLLLAGCPSGSEGIRYDSGTWVNIPDNWVEFTCNDPAMNEKGFSYTYDTGAADITGISAQVKLVSGSADTGYGLLICYQNLNTFYRASIVNDGYYQVSRCLDGTFTYYTKTGQATWMHSDKLNRGFNAANTLKFVLDNSGSVPKLVLTHDAANFPDTLVRLQFKKNTINPAFNKTAVWSRAVLSEAGL